MKRAICAAIAATMLSGCAHTRLSRHSVKQARTLSDIQQQQVLENLALICSNPGALPHFATADGGGTRISDSANAGTRLSWNITTLTGVTGDAGVSTNLQENWTLNPINDPVKLDLIRCVLLYATGRINCDGGDLCCDDCVNKLNLFFKSNDWATCDLPPPCFFRVLDREPCEDDCCVKWAEECGTIVAVDRCRFAHLTRLTLAILDIATISSEDLSKRMNPSTPKIEVKESFLATVDGKLRWIEGEYSLSESKYKEVQNAGISRDKALLLLQKGVNPDGADLKDLLPKNGAHIEGLGSPLRFERQGERRETGNSIEALIQGFGG